MRDDALSDILRTVRLAGAVFFRACMSAPWGVASPPADVFLEQVLTWAQGRRLALFHVVTEGECLCLLPEQDPVRLTRGDMLLLTGGSSHVMASAPEAEVQPAAALLPADVTLGKSAPPAIAGGGGGAVCELLCGAFLFDGEAYNPILDAMPDQATFRLGEDSPTPWLSGALDHVVREAEAERPGSSSLLERLTELLFVELVRTHMQRLPEDQRGWLAGLRDPVVGRTLDLMHGDPKHDWTVDELARRAGVARSKLAARFVELMDQPPIKYLSTWRLHQAARLLSEEQLGVGEVAREVGYESESSFSRAFKRQFGTAPAAWVRERRARLAARSLRHT